MSTLKSIIDIFEDLTNKHKQLQEFSFGQLSEISTKDHSFPMLHLYSTTSEIYNYAYEYGFEIYVMDLRMPDNGNQREILSDTFLIGDDIIHELTDRFYEEGIEIVEETSISTTPFEARFDDDVDGWVFEIKVRTPRIKCNSPIDD